MEQGTVKWFEPDKGYGFITQDGSDVEIFVHYTALIGECYRNLEEGQRVCFELREGKHGPQADAVRLIETSVDE